MTTVRQQSGAFNPKQASVAYWTVLGLQFPLFLLVELFLPSAMTWVWTIWVLATLYRCLLQALSKQNRRGDGKLRVWRLATALYGEALIMLIPVVLAGLLVAVVSGHGNGHH